MEGFLQYFIEVFLLLPRERLTIKVFIKIGLVVDLVLKVYHLCYVGPIVYDVPFLSNGLLK